METVAQIGLHCQPHHGPFWVSPSVGIDGAIAPLIAAEIKDLGHWLVLHMHEPDAVLPALRSLALGPCYKAEGYDPARSLLCALVMSKGCHRTLAGITRGDRETVSMDHGAPREAGFCGGRDGETLFDCEFCHVCYLLDVILANAVTFILNPCPQQGQRP